MFIIDRTMLGEAENAFVPDGERCILVNGGTLDSLFERFFMTGHKAFQEHNSFDKALVLALVFLHELGHLHYADTGSYGKPAQIKVSEIHLPSVEIVNREVRADRFAAELLASAWASQEMHAPIPGPYGRAAVASNIFRAIATGSNTHDFRNDPQGILDGVPKPALLLQSGYSHLNLYVRLLILLEQLEPSEARLAELRWIADALARNEAGPRAR